MAEANTPSRERQRLQAQFARDERTIFTQIRAFFRAPATIDSLLIMNVMSKLFMVSAITFIWARTRPLGSVGRNILAFLTVSDIGITQFLWEFNDLQSWRLAPPQNDDVAIQTEPESIEMTRVVVEPDAAALPSSEFVGVRSLRAIEARNRRLRAAVQSDAPPALPSFEFERAIPRPLRQRNLHPRIAEGTGVSQAGPRVSFQLPVETVRYLYANADVDVEVASSLPSLDSETTPTPPDTEESVDDLSVSSLVFGASLDSETTPTPANIEESVDDPSVREEKVSTSEPSRPSSIATTIPGAPGGGWSTSGPSRRSSLATTIPEVAEVKDSASESSFESDTATMLPEVAEEKDFASELSLKLDIAATLPETEEKKGSALESSPKSDIAATLPKIEEKKDSTLENSLKSDIAAILRKVGEEKDLVSLFSQKLDTVVTEQEVEEESPRAGSNIRNLWGKVKGWGKQHNDRNNGNDQNQGNNRNNGRGRNHDGDSGQSDSNPDWDIVKENRHLLKDDASKDSSDD
ncbi:hypothetical protein CFAM422_003995 [Trichoderma lentiforme]|uniref:Uncharacterized protein n=1 Tax=Trichoderma lentiforme TaxID=1567552 RepID=A0A9P4XIP4_9HYPO|nr:hypothetical protein CFAM422_003995 [Trichoderma lentiforme]